MTPTHEALLNHACTVGNTCCHPMSGRYCAAGRELWLAHRAECVAEGGRAVMEMVRIQSSEWADEVKRRALVLIEAKNKSERKAA